MVCHVSYIATNVLSNTLKCIDLWKVVLKLKLFFSETRQVMETGKQPVKQSTPMRWHTLMFVEQITSVL